MSWHGKSSSRALQAALAVLFASVVASPAGAAPSDKEAERPPIALVLGPVWLTPVIAPAYTPELGALLFGGLVASWKADAESPRSSLAATSGVATTGAFLVNARAATYWWSDRLRLDLDVWVKDMPDHYFGVGYAAGRDTPLGPTTTAYHRLWWQVAPTVLLRIAPALYAGAALDGNTTEATELSAGVAADPLVVRQGTSFSNMGFGGVLRYDSRDFPQNAWAGSFAQAKLLGYAQAGGASGYAILDVDVRHYVPIHRPGQTLAFNLRLRDGFGDVPWPELSQLGSPFDLRGYRWGRYRDRTMVYALVELRHMFLATADDGARQPGRHGIVTWLGLGALGDGLGALGGVLPNAGVGYRFAIQGRLTIRADVGIGYDAQAAYVNFAEAF
jgi:hypothetical protein